VRQLAASWPDDYASTASTRNNERPEHDPEEWIPIFGKDHAPTIKQEIVAGA
jgi:hypothetical protein